MIFTRQLATLIDSGLPLLRSLNVLENQERDKVLKKTINKLADSVQSGNTFSDALALHPRIFNNLYVNMVRAGEVGGVLELVLTRLSEFQEKAAKIKNKVLSAMVYPIIVMTMAVGIMCFLLVFIVPRFEAIFHDLLGDNPLPPVTRFVLAVSNFMQHDGLVLLGAVVVIIVLYNFINRTRRGRLAIDTFKLRMPLFGNLNSKTSISRFARTLGTLVSSGVPILQALTLPRDRGQCGHRWCNRAGARQCKGRRINCATAEASKKFPAMVVSMIDVGEETGKLPEMLLKVADVSTTRSIMRWSRSLRCLSRSWFVSRGDRWDDCARPLHAAHQHHHRVAGKVTGAAEMTKSK